MPSPGEAMNVGTDNANVDANVEFTVVYKHQPLPISLATGATVADLAVHLETLTQIPAENQKIILSGKNIASNLETSIGQLSLKSGASKMMLIGTTADAVEKIARKEEVVAQARRRQQERERQRRKQPQERLETFFDSIEVLPGFADASKARALLTQLSLDIAIRNIMKKRGWRVGLLKELHPSEKTILGYNQSKGQQIALRLRTDELDGFRHYPTIRTVLLHELAHIVHSDHDQNFHALNRLLNKECDSFSNATSASGHRGGYKPDEEEAIDAPYQGGTFKLGGKPTEDPMREAMAAAALLRLTAEEQRLVDECDKSHQSHK